MGFGSEAKIADFHLHLVRQKHISQFEVSVHDTLRVDVFHAVDELRQVVPHLGLCEDLPVFKYVDQRLEDIGTEKKYTSANVLN